MIRNRTVLVLAILLVLLTLAACTQVIGPVVGTWDSAVWNTNVWR